MFAGKPNKGILPSPRYYLYVFVPGLVAALIGYVLPGKLFHTTIMGSPSSDAFVFACIPVIAFSFPCGPVQKAKSEKGSAPCCFIFGISIIFWALYYQNFTAYSLWGRSIHRPHRLLPDH